MSADTTPQAIIRSRGEFQEAARALMLGLPEVKPRDVLVVDLDFSPWPLGDPDIVGALTQWVRLPGRRLRLLGGRFDVLEREQSRFANWRRSFAHALECLTPSEIEPTDVPSLLLTGAVGLELLDRERWQGRRSEDRSWLVSQRERIDALLQRSEPAWPTTVLGL